ncbi:MAG TPA: ABC transporter ATP-binding protein [Thermoanaerobaculia bacterium]|nr:ABC transporter ATP-binding protein [Thermoanaerobaculia bacterium]
MSDFLRLEGLEKRFGSTAVTRGVSLSAARGEIVALLGPSGSGKTTVLRLVAGFETPDAGRIVVEGEDVTALAPERRRFGMVFQHYALFPHMTAGENVGFGLAAQGARAAETRGRVAEMLALAGLSGFENRRVAEISGGQQQRVALARALAPSPRVLLLDEPLSNLDPTLREHTRRELKRAIRKVSITTLFVTHEQEEAFELGDRVAVLDHGRLEQIGTPEELFERPATRFVATFIGRSSVVPVAWDGGARIPGGPLWPAVAGAPLAPGAAGDLVVRPEALAFAAAARPDAVPGSVTERRFAGRVAYFRVATAAGELEVLAAPDAAAVGDRVLVVPEPSGPAPRVFPRMP